MACGGHRSGLKPFVGSWVGHTRQLTVTAKGEGSENVGEGCCDPVVTLRFTVEKVQGAVAHIRVTHVRIYDMPHGRPFVGERGTITLRNGVFTSSVTDSTYCEPNVMACGA